MAVAATVAGAAGPGTPVTLDSLFAEYIADQESTKVIARVAQAAQGLTQPEREELRRAVLKKLPPMRPLIGTTE